MEFRNSYNTQNSCHLSLVFIFQLLFFYSSILTAQSQGEPFLAKPFQNNVFIKEQGQFSKNAKETKTPFREPVLYGVENPEFNAYFTSNGIIFQYAETKNTEKKERKELEKKGKGKGDERDEGDERDVETIWHTATMHWLNSNAKVELVPEQKESAYYNYGGFNDNSHYNFVPAYKKIKYINLYPGVDAEFEFPEEGGIKYKFLVQPNVVIPSIIFEWEGLEKISTDEKGNLHLLSKFNSFAYNFGWQLVDHAPNAYSSKSHTNIPVNFSVDGNKVKFQFLSETISSPEGIVIDPYIINPSFSALNKAFEIQEDSLGNIIIIGNNTNWEVQKYNSSGVLQWTYVTYSVLMGDIAVDNPGNVYIIGGYTAGKRQKLDPSGVQLWSFGGLLEEWRLAFNYSKTILSIGGFFMGPHNLAKLDINTGAISNVIVYGAETRSIATDCNGDIYSLHVTFGDTGDASSNTLRKTNANFTPAASMSSGFLLSESQPASSCYGLNPAYSATYTYQVFNGITVNGPFVFIYDGATIRRINKTTLTVINSVSVPNGVTAKCGGITADLCGNIYVGSTNGIVKFDSSLTYISTISTLKPVYDLILGKTGKLLACGEGFFGSFVINCIAPPPLTATVISTNASCNGGTATIVATGGVTPYTFLWQPGGQTTITASQLAPGTYTYTVTGPFCHTYQDTVTIHPISLLTLSPGTIGVISPGVISNESCPNSLDGSVTVSASGGTGPFLYSWNTNPIQYSQIATGLSAGIYLATVIDIDSCTDTVSVIVTRNPAPIAVFGSTIVCHGNATQFTDSSTITFDTINSWTWDFGDGSAINTTQNPSYIYPSPGTYNTLLTVLTTNGCTDTATKTTIVYPRPVVQFDTSIVCKGDTVQFNNLSTIISPGTIQSYNWDFGDGSPPSASQNPSHFFNAAGTYNVKLVAFSNMACKDSIINTIIINPAIHAESGFGNDTLCTGGTILLGANPTATGGIPPFVYEWSPAIGLNDSTIANPTATITSNILFEITITDSIGCKAFDSVFVIYNPSGPNAEAGFGNDTLCSGGMVLLGGAPTCFGGTAPYTYSWLPLSGLNNPSSPNPTATITANKTYVLTVTDANGCQDIDTVFLIYNATGPFANAGFGNNTLCTGGTVLLGGAPTASGGTSPYTYNWIPSAGLNNNAFANPTATITSNSTYVLIVSDATGCQNIDSVFLTYNANGPFADAGFGNNSLCTSGSLLLGGTPTGSGGVSPYTFLWLPAAGLNGATLSNPVATVNANTNYVVIVNDGIGCQDIDTVSVIYNSNGPDAEAGYGNDTLCTGGIILLGGTPTATNGLPPYTYTWLPNSGLNSNAFSNPTASIFMDTFYVVCVSDANACQDIDTVFLNYNATGPFANAGFGNNTLCTGGTVLLGGAPTASGGISPYTYSWIPSAGLNNNTFANPTATITGNSTYVLIVSDATGCQNIDSVSLTYNANGPFADAGFGNNSLCTGGSLLLGGTPTGSGGVSPYTFLWLPAAGLNGATLSNPVATVNANSNYVVIVTDSDGCQNIDTVAVTYNSNGPVAEAGFGNNNLCTGGTILLGGSPTVVGGIAPYSYTWLPATGLNNASIANPLATLTGDTVYVIIITDVTGCQDIDSVAISYHPSGPFADAGIGNPALCYGYPIVLGGIPSASAGVSPYTYFWLPAAGLNSNIISNPTDTIGTSNTIYYLTVTDALGCSDLDSTYVAILGTGIIANFIATPNQGIEPLVVQFTNQSIGSGLSYQWNFGDNGTSTTENPYHIFYNSSDTAFNFLITLIATDTNGCIDTALLKALLVDPTNINTFPNVFTPNDDGVNDVFKFDLGNVSLVSAVIFNRWGQKILEWNTPLGGWDGRTASAEPAASGVYFYILTIMDKDKKSTQKLGSILLER